MDYTVTAMMTLIAEKICNNSDVIKELSESENYFFVAKMVEEHCRHHNKMSKLRADLYNHLQRESK